MSSTFQAAHSRYKRKGDHPQRIDDLGELVDFAANPKDPRIENLASCGLTVVVNALSEELQDELAWRALSIFCELPHRTNLMNLNQHPEKDTMLEVLKKSPKEFDKMSWSTMGYHYDWTNRVYPQVQGSDVPDLLIRLGRYFTAGRHPTYTPKAVIVNYYNEKSQMGGHRDDLEYALEKPIVSLSLGRPCVFLLGGNSKEDPVVPLLLRKGDVMIMDGASRMYYHGMARLLPESVSSTVSSAGSLQQLTLSQLGETKIPRSETETNLLYEYLKHHRINMNLRQVYTDD